MPRCPTTGTITRARFTSLKLGELSSVDRPAQIGALATIMKRRDDNIPPVLKARPSLIAMAVAKYVDEEDGAHTFNEVLQANEFDEKIWPMTSALSQSIRSIMGDTSIKQPERETQVTQSVDEFLSAVRNLSPTAATDAEKRLLELISKKDDTMKTVAELIAENPALKAHIDGLNLEITNKAAALTAAEQKLKDAEDAKVKAEKALIEGTDEVIKVDDTTEVRKSAVGEAQFAVLKALDNKAVTATLEKRASDEFGHVVGSATEKALVLKHAATMDEATRKAFDAIMASNEAMAKGAFGRLGAGDDGGPTADVTKARETFATKVSEIEKRDSISRSQAMSKARREHPDEYEAAYPSPADAE